jgi:hypothetical protein
VKNIIPGLWVIRSSARLKGDRLRCHAAGPEDRHLTRTKGDEVAIVVGPTQIGDPIEGGTGCITYIEAIKIMPAKSG